MHLALGLDYLRDSASVTLTPAKISKETFEGYINLLQLSEVHKTDPHHQALQGKGQKAGI